MNPACTPERWRNRKFATWVIGAACLAGCRRTDGPAPAPSSTADRAVLLGIENRVHPIGELGQARDYTLRVESVRDCPAEPPRDLTPGSPLFFYPSLHVREHPGGKAAGARPLFSR